MRRTVIKIEDDDDEMDERTARRWKRRCIANGTYKPDALCVTTSTKSAERRDEVDDIMRDEDYEKYLSLVPDGVDTSIDVRSNDEVDDRANVLNVSAGDVNGDMDSDYKCFLENLREDGNSYVLKIVQEDGSLKQIRFHQDNGPLDELNVDHVIIQVKEARNRKSVENLEDATKKKSHVKKKKKKKKKKKSDKVGHLKDVSDGRNVHSCKRPRLEAPNTPQSLRSSWQEEKTETRRSSRRVVKKAIREDCSEKLFEKSSSMLEKNVHVDDADRPCGRTNEHSHRHGDSEYLRSSENKRNSEAESYSVITDDNYQEFLSRTKVDGKKIVFTPKNCGPLTYDPDVDSSSDSDLIVLDGDPREGYRTPIVDVDSGRCIESHSQFRQGIMKDLRRPYNTDEYVNLLEDWSHQRPPSSHDRNLRNGNIKSYAMPGEFGKSYQEMYKDVAGKMDKSGDNRPKRLNLLRGFFYWLMNVAQEGSFQPWNDQECLKVLPRNQ